MVHTTVLWYYDTSMRYIYDKDVPPSKIFPTNAKMIKNKNVVHAQRKFAVGAVVPVQPERRVEPTPAALPQLEPRDVQHCGMSATQLLNSVMMKGIHTHKVSQPVVVLERMIKNENTPNLHILNNENTMVQIQIENVRSLKTPTRVTKKTKSDTQKESPPKQSSSRSLRSQAPTVNTNGERKRRLSESSVTDAEDNRPLKFLKKTNRNVTQKNTIPETPKSTPTESKRVSARQMKLRLTKIPEKKKARQGRIRKKVVTKKITKTIKRRKKGSARVQSEEQPSTSRVSVRTAPHTRSHHDADVAPSLSPGQTAGKRSTDKVRRTTKFKTPRPQRRPRCGVINKKTRALSVRRCACGDGYFNSCDRCSILTRLIAMGDTEQRHDELERVVTDLVDRARRSPSVRPLSFSQRSTVNETSNTMPNEITETFDIEQDPNEQVETDDPDQKSSELRCMAASDVYAFNEDSEVQAEPSPFRATRPRAVQRFNQPRSLSLDQANTPRSNTGRAPDVDYITRLLDMQAHVLTTYINRPRRSLASVVRRRHVEQVVEILNECKQKMLMEENEQGQSSRTLETFVINDDDDDVHIVPKREPDGAIPGCSKDPPRPVCSGISQGSTSGVRAPPPAVEPANDDDDDEGPEIAEAPSFYPTKEEMKDLISYIEKIESSALKYGIFKIVPPREFQPPCQFKNVQFKCTNQYISSMFTRWGPATSEMTAIKVVLATQSVPFTRPPLFDGVEVDLVKLYKLVQEHGGLIRVMEERKWDAIAEKMQLNARAGRVKAAVKLDKIYMKHLLPYDTLSEKERQELRERVNAAWLARHQRQRARASRPLHRQLRLLGEAESSEDDEELDRSGLASAFDEVDDCVVPGCQMNVTRFNNVNERVRDMHFPGTSTEAPPHWAAVERAYWKLVRSGTEHVCVHGAALDTTPEGLGFTAEKSEPYGIHPWNLKRLGESDSNVLSSLGPTLAVTVPILHLGMTFSTNCWHLDPHNLPWTEYLHQGAPKIWYGIADSESNAFRAAAEQLCPTAVQQKKLWLPSDTAMLPPRLLAKRGVRLVRTLQAPGEYVVVLPRAFSCSISAGLTISENLYFASDTWLDGVDHVFAALREDAEPSMFSLEALLEGVVKNPNAPITRKLRARALLRPMLHKEMKLRQEATTLGVREYVPRDFLKDNRRCSKSSWQVVRDECHICRATLHWSKIIEVSSRMSMCLQHGLRVVRGRHPNASNGQDVEGFTTILFYANNAIQQLLTDIGTHNIT